MEQIADALGVTVSELESAGITEAEIETGATITIPPELCQVDAEGLQAAIAEQTSGQADAGTVEVQADTTVTPGNVEMLLEYMKKLLEKLRIHSLNLYRRMGARMLPLRRRIMLRRYKHAI